MQANRSALLITPAERYANHGSAAVLGCAAGSGATLDSPVAPDDLSCRAPRPGRKRPVSLRATPDDDR